MIMAAGKLQAHLSKIRSPFGGEKVYKDECCFCFDTPECETGLYICMNSFLGFGKKYVEQHFQKTGNAVFLHMRRIKREIPPSEDDPPKKKPTKLAIGIEGGFDLNEKKYEIEEHNSVVVLPDWTEIPLPNAELPDVIQISSAAIIAADSAAKAEELAAMAGTWDGEKRIISKYAENLLQLDNGKKIPPRGWKCERCDLKENLWLNLTDGSILCGRKFWDGSGGNNHAVDYYAETKYPLAVKLGTITADGADVYSYDEDDMVEDPLLAKHLAHFGINILDLEKTDKSMAELEIDLNQKIGEWDVIQEAGSKLEPVYGPGCTGMRNLGNSCYMNSVMQVLFTVPDFQQRYANRAKEMFRAAPNDPTTDFNIQMAKLGHGLLSGEYSKPPPGEATVGGEPVIKYQEGIRPQMFKTLVGRGHPEFSTKRQQDAQEFLLHLINMIERNSRGSENPTDSLKFQVEERVQCTQSKKVKYTTQDSFLLGVPIPIEAAVNKEEVAAYEAKKKQAEAKGEKLGPKELVRPRVPLSACVDLLAAPEVVDDFYSTAVQAKTTAQKTTRLKTFPDYLFIQLKKFTVSDNWTPVKLDVSVDAPDDLDLTALRGQGLQAGEEELPEDAAGSAEPEVNINEGLVSQVMDMGFPLEACKKAVYHTNNAGLEQAMEWVMTHMEDSDFAAPLQLPGAKKKGASEFVPNEEHLAMIMSMGFSREQATKALKATDNQVDRAADWIFSHAGELDMPMETDQSGASEQEQAGSQCRDGSGKYKLQAFISHMGTSTQCGHYVCHIFKDGRWVIFNDEKVALSEHPPKDLAYLYMYRRI